MLFAHKNWFFFQQFLIFRVALRRMFMRVLQCICVMLLMQEPAFWCRTRMCCALFSSRGIHTRVVVLSWTRVNWHGSEEIVESSFFFFFFFFFFFLYAQSFFVATLNYGWTTDVTWTILMMSLLHIWVLNVMVVLLSMQDQKALGFHQKYLNLCSEDERRSYRFEITRGWVINDIIFIFGWTIPLSWDNGQALFNCLILIKKNIIFILHLSCEIQLW